MSIRPTSASWSNFPNNWFNISTSSGAVHDDDKGVKFTMSAYNMLSDKNKVLLDAITYGRSSVSKAEWSILLNTPSNFILIGWDKLVGYNIAGAGDYIKVACLTMNLGKYLFIRY